MNTPQTLVHAERRRRVAELYRARVKQTEIARRLGCSQGTVSRDLAVVIREDRAAAGEAIAKWLARELADLERMESQVSVRYAETQDVRWIDARLAIKARRVKLLGLDAPSKIAPTTPDGTEQYGGDLVAELTAALDTIARRASGGKP